MLAIHGNGDCTKIWMMEYDFFSFEKTKHRQKFKWKQNFLNNNLTVNNLK